MGEKKILQIFKSFVTLERGKERVVKYIYNTYNISESCLLAIKNILILNGLDFLNSYLSH